jgi:hypothetical protein
MTPIVLTPNQLPSARALLTVHIDLKLLVMRGKR